jgi:putative acetyltransferase
LQLAYFGLWITEIKEGYLLQNFWVKYSTSFFMQQIQIRIIEETDNPALAKIIRDTLAEFGANHAGTVYYDPTTDYLFEMFQNPLSIYFAAEMDGELVGGGGIYPTDGLPDKTCELVKMYLLPVARGKGIGKMIIAECLEKAAGLGFENIYLETMPELQQAMRVYEKFGFQYLNGPLGNSGHFGCSRWMLKELSSIGQ